MSKSETVLEMIAAGLDAPWETTTPLMHRRCNDGVIQLSPLSSYAVLEVVEISHACFTPCLTVFPTHFSQLDLNSANLEATVQAEWILAFLFLRKRNFQWCHTLRHHYRHHCVVSCKYWWDILQFTSHTYCRDVSCQKLWKVVYICQSYGKNTVGPFFKHGLVTSVRFLSRSATLKHNLATDGLFIRPSVRLSHSGTESKLVVTGSLGFHHR